MFVYKRNVRLRSKDNNWCEGLRKPHCITTYLILIVLSLDVMFIIHSYRNIRGFSVTLL